MSIKKNKKKRTKDKQENNKPKKQKKIQARLANMCCIVTNFQCILLVSLSYLIVGGIFADTEQFIIIFAHWWLSAVNSGAMSLCNFLFSNFWRNGWSFWGVIVGKIHLRITVWANVHTRKMRNLYLVENNKNSIQVRV